MCCSNYDKIIHAGGRHGALNRCEINGADDVRLIQRDSNLSLLGLSSRVA